MQLTHPLNGGPLPLDQQTQRFALLFVHHGSTIAEGSDIFKCILKRVLNRTHVLRPAPLLSVTGESELTTESQEAL